MKYISFYFLFFIIYSNIAAQNITLYSENFNSSSHSFELNSNEVGGDFGDNTWIVNDDYDGKGIYPNTTPQDSTTAGSIGGAPFSKYLHIHDSRAVSQQNVANANYNPFSGSDRFVAMKDGICTKSLENVKISFYHLVKGAEDAYALLYYKKDGSGWQLATNDTFRQSTLWERYDLSNNEFNNASELKFGFRWVNDSSSGSISTGFSADDIIIVADYNQNTTVSATALEDSVCKGGEVTIKMQLSDTLCSGIYLFILSDEQGIFQNGTSMGMINWNESFPTKSNFNIPIPQNVQPGSCYKIKIDRIQPAPFITGIASNCFEIVDCPAVIKTKQPPALKGSEDSMGYAICAGSKIDVPFTAFGTINQDNEYKLKLGTQLDTLISGTVVIKNSAIIKSKPDPNDYPGNADPGIISATLPMQILEGCNYYLQVNSTSPATEGTIYGPFCIRHCDITTNQTQDIVACITDSSGFEQRIAVQSNTWDSSVTYLPGNIFRIQLLDADDFTVVNTGDFGSLVATSIDSITFLLPSHDSLQTMGIVPGEYYLRVMASMVNKSHDSLGSLIGLTIGYTTSYIKIEALDSVRCKNSTVQFEVKPFNTPSGYEWKLFDGRIFDGNGSVFNIVANSDLDVAMQVREISNGCVGQWSNWDTVNVIEPPDATITAPDEMCKHEEVSISAPYDEHTFYDWDPGANGTIISNNKNDLLVRFDTVGRHNVTLSALNQCGSDAGFKTISVIDTVATIAGNLETSNNDPMDDTKVLLIRYNPLDSSLLAIDTALTLGGIFGFQTTGTDLYVKALPDSADYPNQIPTYYNSVITWDRAVSLSDSFCLDAQINFSTISGNNPGGPGFISGKVTEGAGKKQGAGDAIPSMTLFLMNKQGQPVTYAITDKDGWFEISNIPVGEYQLIGDWPYLKNDEAPTLVLTVNNPKKDSLHIRMVDRKLEVGTLTGWFNDLHKSPEINIYPNPADQLLVISRNPFYRNEVSFGLYDLWGKKKRSGILHQPVEYLDVSRLNSGIYIIRINAGKVTVLRKIVIVH